MGCILIIHYPPALLVPKVLLARRAQSARPVLKVPLARPVRLALLALKALLVQRAQSAQRVLKVRLARPALPVQ